MTAVDNLEHVEQQRRTAQSQDEEYRNPNEFGVGNYDFEDDDITIVYLEQRAGNVMDQGVSGWGGQDSPEMEERRRTILLHELRRVQRASFVHFMILCLIPTSLLFVVVAAVLGDDEDCESAATTCVKEARTFLNAFTTRCVCDAVAYVTMGGTEP